MTQNRLTWKRHAVSSLGVELDVLDGSPPSEGAAGGIRYLTQRHAAGEIGVWAGPDETAARWRAGIAAAGATPGREEATTLCGRPATRIEATFAAEAATGLVARDGGLGHREHRVPRRVHVVVLGTLADGTPVRIGWAVDADQREALRADEARFFASLSCT